MFASTGGEPKDLFHDGRLYAVGDIHGRLDLLDQLIDAIRRDAENYAGNTLTVTLGDYVDRGPSSRGVLERLATNPFPGGYIALKGNHEAMLERFIKQPEIGDYWRRLGGLETLDSFGIPVAPVMMGKNYAEAARQLQAALSPTHTEFLKSLRTSITVGRFFLCHAGVRPGVPFADQNEEDLLWIRDDFLNSEMNFGKIVVHGHTPVREPEFRSNRINIDTGAFATGRLTCVIFEGDSCRIIET